MNIFLNERHEVPSIRKKQQRSRCLSATSREATKQAKRASMKLKYVNTCKIKGD